MSSTELATMPTIRPGGVLEVARHLREIWELAEILVRSRMIPNSINTPEAAAAIILKGHELGIGPMQSFDSISVIQGKPTLSPQLMLALIERSGTLQDMAVAETPDSCEITMTRRGRTPQSVRFDRSEAVAMGLAGKDNWRKQFGVMMYWRCVAKACRRVFPDVIAGCYTPDEMGAEVSEDGEILEAEVVRQRKVRVHLDPDDGNLSHVDGEIIEEPAPRQKSAPGLFGKEHVARTQEYAAWLGRQCDRFNARWHESWERTLDGALAEGRAVPEKVPDAINTFGANGHILKWARSAGLIDATIVPEGLQVRQMAPYAALVFGDHKDALKVELTAYFAQQARQIGDGIYRKFPDLAPDGWHAEQEEAARQADHGDAYEGDMDEAVAAANGLGEAG